MKEQWQYKNQQYKNKETLDKEFQCDAHCYSSLSATMQQYMEMADLNLSSHDSMQCNTDRQNVESKTTTVTKWHFRSAVHQIHV